MKSLLTDTTFIIPIRIEDNQRLNNVKLVLKYLQYHFDTNIILCESSSKSNASLIQDSWGERCKHIWIEDHKVEFHRTRILNYMTKQVITPYVVNCDTDVMVSVNNYIEAIENLRRDTVDFIFPYDGRFFNVPTEYHEEIDSSMNIELVNLNKCNELHCDSVGGIICMNKDKYIESGMENEKFISWGPEDVERVVRWQRLGMRIGRLGGILYHMNHNRQHQNSSLVNPYYKANESEYHKVAQMTKELLNIYIKTWGWLK